MVEDCFRVQGTPCYLICCICYASFNTQKLKIGSLGVVCVCKYIVRFSEISSGLLCELGGKDIVRATNWQLARSAELPCHRVSGYLKSCATVCLRQACLCFVLGREGGGLKLTMKGFDGVRGDTKRFRLWRGD